MSGGGKPLFEMFTRLPAAVAQRIGTALNSAPAGAAIPVQNDTASDRISMLEQVEKMSELFRERSFFHDEIEGGAAVDRFAARATELLVRWAVFGILEDTPGFRYAVLNARANDYHELAEAFLRVYSSKGPQGFSFSSFSFDYYVQRLYSAATAVNVWTLEAWNTLGIDPIAKWEPPFPIGIAQVQASEFLIALACYPQRQDRPKPPPPRSLREEWTDLERELALLDENNPSR